MSSIVKTLLVTLFFLTISVFLFRNYFLKQQVPFPANLLASFYEPWKSYPSTFYPNGAPNKPLGFDNLRIFYPVRKLAIELIKNGQPPLWNPFNFSGNTLLATYQSALFHPLSFLFFLIPQLDAWSIIIMLSPVFAGLGMYLFLKSLKLDDAQSLLGGIVFAFSGFFMVWWEESFMLVYSALTLPWSLWAIEKLVEKPSGRYFFILTLTLATSILSGWFQMTFYGLFFIVAWIVYRKPTKQIFFLVTLAGVFATVVSLVHLLPSAEAFIYSARGNTDAKYLFSEYLVSLSHLVTFIAPDLFGNPGAYNYYGRGFYHEKVLFIGFLPFLLLMYELFVWKKLQVQERFFAIVFLVTLSLGFSLPTSWFLLYWLKLPLLSVLIPSRIFFLSTFAASVLVAYAFGRLKKSLDVKPLSILSILVGIILGGLWSYALFIKFTQPKWEMGHIGVHNLVIPTAFLGISVVVLYVSRLKKFQTAVIVCVFAITIASSYLFAQKFLYFSDRRLVFTQVPLLTQLKKISEFDRYWTYQHGYIESNFATYFNLFSPEGYDSFYIRRYGELFSFANNHGVVTADIPRADAKIESTHELNNIQQSIYRQKLLALLGVKYILGTTQTSDDTLKPTTTTLVPVWNDSKYAMYRNTQALPRTFLANNYRVFSSSSEELSALFDVKTDLSQTVLLEQAPQNLALSDRATGMATISAYTPNTVTIQTQSSAPSLLFLSDAWYPGWVTRVDGEQSTIYRANYAFRSVVVPAGVHTVLFSYEPKSFRYGSIGSIIGILCLVGFSVFFSTLFFPWKGKKFKR